MRCVAALGCRLPVLLGRCLSELDDHRGGRGPVVPREGVTAAEPIDADDLADELGCAQAGDAVDCSCTARVDRREEAVRCGRPRAVGACQLTAPGCLPPGEWLLTRGRQLSWSRVTS